MLLLNMTQLFSYYLKYATPSCREVLESLYLSLGDATSSQLSHIYTPFTLLSLKYWAINLNTMNTSCVRWEGNERGKLYFLGNQIVLTKARLSKTFILDESMDALIALNR